MDMLFRDLDEAFFCISEFGLELLRNSTHSPSMRLSRNVTSSGKSHSLAEENLESLHDRLMSFARKERYPEALVVIQKMMDLVTQDLEISRDASKLNKSHVGHAVIKSMTLFRFHLLLLKTEAYLLSRSGHFDLAKTSLEKVLEFDGSNRLGARELLERLPSHLNS